MRRQRKTDKKEINYSVWLTGIVLVLVYIILFDNISRESEIGIESILWNQLAHFLSK